MLQAEHVGQEATSGLVWPRDSGCRESSSLAVTMTTGLRIAGLSALSNQTIAVSEYVMQ